MTWPVHATRAEILRILEINAHTNTEWVITRAETEAVLALLADDSNVMARYLAAHDAGIIQSSRGDSEHSVREEMRRRLGATMRPDVEPRPCAANHAMDERARAAAEELETIATLLDSAGSGFLDWKGQLFDTARDVQKCVADAVAQAVKERDEEIVVLRRHLSVMTLDKMQQAEETARLTQDVYAYAGALGYPIPGDHTGRHSNGTTPQCGLCGPKVAQATRAERERWIDYVEWFVQASQGAYTMAWIHGHRDGDELIEEGKRRRAALNYVPKAEALRRAPTEPAPGGHPAP